MSHTHGVRPLANDLSSGPTAGNFSADQLSSLVREVIPGSSLLSAVRIAAGSSSVLTELVVTVSNSTQRLILRSFVSEWQGTPSAKAKFSTLVQSALMASGVPVPQVIWVDISGERLGYPSILETRLRGRVFWPSASKPGAPQQMGRALRTIHAVAPPKDLPNPSAWVRWTMRSDSGRSGWLHAHPKAGLVAEAISSAAERPLRRQAVCSHGDFGPGNVLWFRGHLSGIIDWETAEQAPPGSDVGACRLDCFVTGGPAMAEAFLEGYSAEVQDSWYWELLCALKFVALYRDWLPIWRSFGLNIDQATARSRIDAAIDDALRRAS
jgi:aminoglycoside phosphotransferase (APT) family kinase protein